MHRIAAVCLFASVLTVSSPAVRLDAAERPQEVTVPTGTAVLPDGRMEPAEWDDAAALPLGEHAVARIKRDGEYLYVGVQPGTSQQYGIDLYFDDGRPTILNLHASASLGERDGSGEKWPEWSWWNNREWIANVARVETWEPRTFLRDEAKEFQVRLSRFRNASIGFGLDVATREGALMLPAGEAGAHGRTWIRLNLNR
jgi:hypothetical protein